MSNMVEFGTLKIHAQFEEPCRDLLFGNVAKGERHRKIKETRREGRLVNAKTIDGEEYCWIAPSHRVLQVR